MARNPAGVFTGYPWSRYRTLWAPIAAHTAMNTFPLLLRNYAPIVAASMTNR